MHIIELPLSTEPPDILGFSKVSELYGPGTWAAWFLCIAGSWIDLLFHHKKKVDVNLWASLWASTGRLSISFDAARVYALFTTLLPGSTRSRGHKKLRALAQHCLWLLGAACMPNGKSSLLSLRKTNLKGVALSLGLLLPPASIVSLGIYLGLFNEILSNILMNRVGPESDIADHIPGLYWKGIDMDTYELLGLLSCVSWRRSYAKATTYLTFARHCTAFPKIFPPSIRHMEPHRTVISLRGIAIFFQIQEACKSCGLVLFTATL